MPKTLTEKKEIIRNTLIQKGRELFSKYSLEKTSITELTKAAGIAAGFIFYMTRPGVRVFFKFN